MNAKRMTMPAAVRCGEPGWSVVFAIVAPCAGSLSLGRSGHHPNVTAY
jgi:hypothetical protein